MLSLRRIGGVGCKQMHRVVLLDHYHPVGGPIVHVILDVSSRLHRSMLIMGDLLVIDCGDNEGHSVMQQSDDVPAVKTPVHENHPDVHKPHGIVQ